jgi:hypothetical protein
MVAAVGAVITQAAALVVYQAQSGALITQAAALTVSPVTQARSARVSQTAALLVAANTTSTIPRVTQTANLLVYGTGLPDVTRKRAWTFTLDGHPFYVLSLGIEGTFLFDVSTQQWCQFNTDGYENIWDMVNGVQWGERIIGGSALGGYVYELDPTVVVDEDWADIVHVSTGALTTRGRIYHSVDSVILSASVGDLGDSSQATVGLSWSDDNGATWSAVQTITLDASNYSQEVAWRSLGSFAAPGRVFKITDSGGMVRIDGADVMVDGFDEDPAGGTQ